MSNSQAIAAVTATLQSLLQQGVTVDPDLNDATVTLLPLDRARGNNNNNQLNLFLYQLERNAAWANADMPRQVQPGESGIPPLPLNLYYLLTAFGRDNDTAKPFGHELMGKAMSVFHDHPVLSADEIKAATVASLPNSDLDRQLDRIRITLHPMSIDELSKLWTGFATQYRLSTAYEVAVALIDSTRPVRTPLPVLARGQNDRGVASQADLTPPFPTLQTVVPPSNQPSGSLNATLTINGFHLDGTNLGVQFMHRLWTAPIEVAPDPGGSASQLTVTIPNQPAAWPAGEYSLIVLLQRPGEAFRRSTKPLSFTLAPAITIAPLAAPAGAILYTVTSAPEVWADQSVALLLGDREIGVDPHTTQTATVTFHAANVAAGEYFVRLRVDGVDSLLVNRAVTPPVFDPTQKVTVT